ncbi:MAG: carboxylating nicotinate-nucleotide diphosphorylase [Chloroflexi bacterium]|nr:carboxylating nicotinate-nucleotide diphosphorylase [Chloroflexota bacterium]
MPLPPVRRLVAQALEEDLAWGDITTDTLIEPSWRARGRIEAQAKGVLAGVEVAGLVFQTVDPDLEYVAALADGQRLDRGSLIATVAGAAASILKGERTALNFLQHLSGIATATASHVEVLAELETRLVDTRKTLPGLRLLQKYAVRVGGGHNHRMHLGDGVLIKDNHLALLRARGIGMSEAVARAKAQAPHTVRVEVEVQSLEELQEAIAAGADIVMLDNMGVEEMERACELAQGRCLLEASGGITFEKLRYVAGTGVDMVSLGRLTHSVQALDIHLELEPA